MSKKITKREKFEMLKAIPTVAQNEMLMDFINHELELLTRKNSSEKKPTAQQMLNEETKAIILEVLAENGGLMTITEIQKSHNALADLSNQRVSSLVRQLRDDLKVERVEDKRKAYFRAI